MPKLASRRIPENWNRWWLLMWAVNAPVPVSPVKKDDSVPPQTHTIRHFLPD